MIRITYPVDLLFLKFLASSNKKMNVEHRPHSVHWSKNGESILFIRRNYAKNEHLSLWL